MQYFAALGLELNEGWGMSESSCFGTLNPPDRIRQGLDRWEEVLKDEQANAAAGLKVMLGCRSPGRSGTSCS